MISEFLIPAGGNEPGLLFNRLMRRQEIVEKYHIPPELQSEVFSVLRPISGSGEGALYLKSLVDRQLHSYVEQKDRPGATLRKSFLKEEDLNVIDFARAMEPFERIAEGIDRLIEVLVPRAEDTKQTVSVMFTPAEAAKQMKLNVQTVREWCREGKLGVRAGRKWLISPDEVKLYLRGQLLIKGRVAG